MQKPKFVRKTNTFSDEAIRSIRAADKRGVSRRDAAEFWDVSVDTIGKICRRDTYAWVEDEPRDDAGIDFDAPETAEERESRERLLRMMGEGK